MAIMLMFLSHYEEFQTTHMSINTKLTSFLKGNPEILENIELPKEYKEMFFQNLDLVKDYPSKLENIKEIIESFQKILDKSVERLFLALE